MSGNEVAVVDQGGSSLVLASDQAYWNENQLASLRQLGVEKATPADLGVYMHVCQRTGLDPFARQIYMIERQGKQTIQTGIDGYRLVARRAVDASRERLAIDSALWCGRDGKWTDVWLEEGPPAAAKVVVHRGESEFTAVALWREYVQTFYKDGQEQVTKMWRSRPAGQLAKCAEALALRKAFPQDLSGVYVDAELDRADVVQGETVRSGGLGAALAAESSSGSDPGGEAPADPAGHPAEGEGSGPEPIDAEEVDMITDAQHRNIGRLMGKGNLNILDPDEARVKCSVIIGREITSRKDLTKDEAGKVINELDFELTALKREQGES